jgi:Tfp pilus assembly protein PilX
VNPRAGRPRGERGTAIIVAMLLVVLLSAIGLGLALTCGIEPTVAANFDASWAAIAAAESAVTLAAHDLAGTPDWSAALAGGWRSPLLAPAAPQDVVAGTVPPTGVATLTHLATCQRPTACSTADVVDVTTDRPWGHNNPVWQVVGRIRAGPGLTLDTSVPFETVVWVGDDPGESDGNPAQDAAPDASGSLRPAPGANRVLVRAEAFGPRAAHAAVEVLVSRSGREGPVRLQRRKVW